MGSRLGRDETLLLEVLNDDRHSALDVHFVCPDVDLGLGGGFVRRRDAGEVCRWRQRGIEHKGVKSAERTRGKDVEGMRMRGELGKRK